LAVQLNKDGSVSHVDRTAAMEQELADTHHHMKSLIEGAQSEGRDLTDAEYEQFENLNERATKAKAGIERRRRDESIKKSLDAFGATMGVLGDEPRDGIETKKPAPVSFGQTIVDKGFDLKRNPAVTIPLRDALTKASSFPAVGDLRPAAPVLVPMGRDERFLNAAVISQSVDAESAVQDFRQSARSVTGSVSRALDATTDKASLDVTLALVAENLQQMAILVPDVPNAILESVSALRAFLNAEMSFQIAKALDAHIMSQVVAATPPFGQSGSDLISKLRNGIASMRAEGANPTITVLNPTDAAALDLAADAGGFVFATRDTGSSSPLWGLRVIERIGAGTEPPYLIDVDMLGRLYLGSLRFEADPFSGFKKNLTTLRLEARALFHVRNAKGARRVAAS
jgi:hypothetical protein